MYDIKFAPQSNRASWTFTVEVTDYDDEAIDMSVYDVVLSIRDNEGRHMDASTDNSKLTFPEIGFMRWSFTRYEMQCFCPGRCEIGLTVTNADDTDTAQFSIGSLNIVDGVVQSV